MGTFVYGRRQGGRFAYKIEDRTLRHVELAIVTKLRRGEQFAFTLGERVVPSGLGTHVLWIGPHIPLQFEYMTSPRQIPINRAWIERLIQDASLPDGLHLVPEPDSVPLGSAARLS